MDIDEIQYVDFHVSDTAVTGLVEVSRYTMICVGFVYVPKMGVESVAEGVLGLSYILHAAFGARNTIYNIVVSAIDACFAYVFAFGKVACDSATVVDYGAKPACTEGASVARSGGATTSWGGICGGFHSGRREHFFEVLCSAVATDEPFFVYSTSLA